MKFLVFIVLFFECYCQSAISNNRPQIFLSDITKFKNEPVTINFCCKPSEIFHNFRCYKSNLKIGPTIDINFKYTPNQLNPCSNTKDYTWRSLDNKNSIFMLENGKIFLNSTGYPLTNEILDEYCLNNYWENEMLKGGILFCEPKSLKEKILNLIFIVITLTIPFSLSTFLIYALNSELRNLHGYLLMSIVICITMRAIYFVIFDLYYWDIKNYHISCINMELSFIYLVFADYCWASVMCFNLWHTFRRPRLNCIEENKGKTKFLIYSIYAWGLPLIYFTVCFNVRSLCERKYEDNSCHYKCSGEPIAVGLIFIVVSVFVNGFFFITTTVNIRKQKKHIANDTEGPESRCHIENIVWFKFYSKLFFLTGMDVLIAFSILIFLEFNFLKLGVDNYTVAVLLLSLLGAMKGVTIFILFVCTKKVKKLILKKIRRK